MATLLFFELKKLGRSIRLWALLLCAVAVACVGCAYHREQLQAAQVDRYALLQQHREELAASNVSVQQLAKAEAGMAGQLTYKIPAECDILQQLEDMTFRQAYICRSNGYQWTAEELQAHRDRLQAIVDHVLDGSLRLQLLPWDYQDVAAVQNEIRLAEYCLANGITSDWLNRCTGAGLLWWSVQSLTALLIIPAIFFAGMDMVSKEFQHSSHVMLLIFGGSRMKMLAAKFGALLIGGLMAAILVCGIAFAIGCAWGGAGSIREIATLTDAAAARLDPMTYGSYAEWAAPAAYTSVAEALLRSAPLVIAGIVFACAIILALGVIAASSEAAMGLSAGLWFAALYLQADVNRLASLWNPVALLRLDGLAQQNVGASLFALLLWTATCGAVAALAWQFRDF